MSLEELIESATELIVRSRHMIALTGAGVSAESGIPTFRGPNGLWRKFKPEELATPEAFRRNPRLVWEWYAWRIGLVLKATPNPAHYALAELEKLGILKCLITQNVDDLHERAGSRSVVHFHGEILFARCTSCGFRLKWSEPPSEIPPRCPKCGSLLRPDVVWFGEPIPEEALRRALHEASRADVILVVGTSGVVQPAGSIPYIVKEHGGTVIEVNVEESAITPVADVFLRGKAGEVLPKLVTAVKRKLGKRGKE